MPEIFGTLEQGTPEQPAITKESVHHYFKTVSGKPLQRPPWFFDVTQQGEGIVDVTTHLVDLVQWEAFPDQILKPDDVRMLAARRWTTKVRADQFEKATTLKEFPAALKANVNSAGELEVFGNGEFTYSLRGVVAKVSVSWNFEAPAGTADTHYSIMRGTSANLIIRQGKEQNYKPTLYVEGKGDAADADFEKSLQAGDRQTAKCLSGARHQDRPARVGKLIIPDSFKIGHEAHFAQVTAKYLKLSGRRQTSRMGGAEHDHQMPYDHGSLPHEPLINPKATHYASDPVATIQGRGKAPARRRRPALAHGGQPVAARPPRHHAQRLLL